MAHPQYKPIPKNPTDSKKLEVAGDPWKPGDWNKPSFKLRIVNGNVWFAGYSNHPDDEGVGPINVKFDISLGYTFLEMLETCVRDPNAERVAIQAMEARDAGKMVKGGKITIGRNAEGVIRLAVEYPGRRACQLKFHECRFANFMDGNGNPLSDKRVSELRCGSFVTSLREILAAVYVKDYVHYVKKKPANNNNAGNNGGGFGDPGTATGGTSEADLFA